VKAEWQTRPFEDCILRVTGTPKIQRKDFLEDGQYPIVSQEEAFINGYWNDDSALFRIDRPVIDFVLGADGVKILSSKEFLVPKFFFYQLQSVDLDTLGYARHYKLLKILNIKYPAIAEQQRIVAILDEAFDGIATAKANAEKNFKNARELFESHLNAVFTQRGEGWMTKSIGDVCIIGDGNHSSNYPKKEELVEQGIPFIRATNLVNGHISGNDMRFLSPQKHAQLKKGHLKTGDILFTNRGEIGKTAIVDSDYNNSNLNSQIAWFRCNNELNNRLLFHILNSGSMKTHFLRQKNGAALQQFTIRQIKELKIQFPTKDKQQKIVDEFDDLEDQTSRLEYIYQQKIASLDELKKSLLHKAFNGEL